MIVLNRRPRSASSRALLTTVMAALMIAAQSATAVPAAAFNTDTTLHFSGKHTIQHRGFATGCDPCVPGDNGLGVRLNVDVRAEWHPDANVNHQFTDNLLRQGQTLDLTNVLTPGTGPLTVFYTIGGDAGIYNFTGSGARFPADGSDRDTVAVSIDVADASTTCALKLDGDGNYTCSTEKDFTLFEKTVLGNGYQISLPIKTDLSISPDGVVSTRTATAGGMTLAGPNTLTFHGPSPSTVGDSLVIPCTATAGAHVLYDLASSSTNPAFVANTSASIKVTIITVLKNIDLGTVSVATVGPDSSVFGLTAATDQADFGPVLPDQDPPTATPGGPYGGVESQPVRFDGSASSDPHCGPPGLSWDFGDGGTASGTSPSHVYAEEGTYTGKLTATNAAGLSSTASFVVNVADAALSATGRSLVTPNPVSGVVASFFDSDGTNTTTDGNQDSTDYSASIDWGDGTITAGTISPNGTGFDVSGTHAYATQGFHTITSNIQDVGGARATATTSVLIFAFTGQSGFVAGDQNATPGTTLNFWGAQWAKQNSMSGGSAPNGFKGFAATTNTSPPSCGGTWTSAPGNSSSPPSTLPSYMAVLVSTSVGKQGSTISGDIRHIVVVRTDPGYAPNPGHAGTGTEVGVFC